MKEYIEREAVLERLAKVDMDTYYGFTAAVQFGVNHAIQCIKEAPAADVAPVRHGRWEPGNPICPVCGENKFKDLDADVWADWQPKFCPNCGARMGKEDEHEAG